MSDKGSILIIQADPISCGALREHFEKGNYRVLVAQTEADALDMTRHEFPRSIILDLDTPGVDAEALIQKIRETPRTRHIHVTLLTQRSERTDKLDGLALGADDFMSKPLDIEELGLRVRNAVRRATFDNLTNPTTGLPGPRLIEQQLRQILRRDDDAWALLRINMRYFNTFSDQYGFLAGEEVLRCAARLFSEAIDRLGCADDFLGHSSADNFILITSRDRAARLVDEIVAAFKTEAQAHYSFRDRERGSLQIQQPDGSDKEVPLMTLNVHTVTAADGPFSDIRELTQAFSG